MATSKERIKVGIKIAVGFLLVAYVLHSKMVDFQTLKAVLFRPSYLVLALSFFTFSAFCCAMRWYLLIRVQNLSPSYKDIFELTMIGNFFNTFMPGAVGGDLIKAWYIAGQEPRQRTKAVFTVLVDRVVGLAVILFYSAATLALFTGWLAGNPSLQAVAYMVWGFSIGAGVFAIIFFSDVVWKSAFVQKAMAFVRRWERLGKLLDALMRYRETPSTVFAAIGLSAVSVFSTIMLYAILGETLGLAQMDLPSYFFLVPLGLTASAVPLLPGGLGVGQVAFFTLFQWMGKPAEGGATLCTLVQLYTILFNCAGGIFYIKFKRRPVELHKPAPMAASQGW